MSLWVKVNNIWKVVTAPFRKVSGNWVSITESELISYLNTNAAIYRGHTEGPGVLTIGGASRVDTETCQYLALFNSVEVEATSWQIMAGLIYASIDSTGLLTVNSNASESLVTIACSYNGQTAVKDLTVTYVSGSSSETETETETVVDPETGQITETTTTTTTTTDEQGNVTTNTTVTEVVTNQDGTSTNVESETTTNPDGSSTSNTTTTNYDENGDVTGSSENETNVNADGSSSSSTTNYNADGDPTDGENQWTDTSGNVDTQDITYDENGDPTVTGYNIDTSGNPEGSKDITGDGVNTGFYPFDGGDGFELHVKFRSVKTEQPNPPLVVDTEDKGANYHFTILCSKDPNAPYPGFHIRWTLNKNNYSSGNMVFGYRGRTGSATNRNLALSKHNNLYEYRIVYDPELKKYPSKFRCEDLLNGAATISLNIDFNPLNYGLTLGYNINMSGEPYRYSNVDILEFSVTKL